MNAIKGLLLAALLAFTNLAIAEEPTNLFGKWTQLGVKGTVIWEFAASTVAFTPFDGTGKAIAPENKANITYRKLSDAWVMNFTRPDGSPGGGLLVSFKDENTVVVDDPGRVALILKRVQN